MIVAMWSGPRNLSTAMMRSFARRADTVAWDEPFYAAYLAATGLDHPMADEVIAAGIADPAEVALACVRERERPVFYQKHMTHHMLEGFPLDWVDDVTSAFLIRAPERVLASYAVKREAVTAPEIGFDMQRALFDRVADRLGAPPPVIDSDDVRADPKKALRGLCAALGLPFDPAMLSWPPGPATEDGVWGRHWYDAIWRSTGFAPPERELPALPPELARIADAVRPHYDYLRRHRIGA